MSVVVHAPLPPMVVHAPLLPTRYASLSEKRPDKEYHYYWDAHGRRRRKKKVSEWMKLMGEKEESSEEEELFHGCSFIHVTQEELSVGGAGESYEVLHKMIALRISPSHDGKVIGVARKGDVLSTYDWDATRRWRKVHFRLPLIGSLVCAWVLLEHPQLGPILRHSGAQFPWAPRRAQGCYSQLTHLRFRDDDLDIIPDTQHCERLQSNKEGLADFLDEVGSMRDGEWLKMPTGEQRAVPQKPGQVHLAALQIHGLQEENAKLKERLEQLEKHGCDKLKKDLVDELEQEVRLSSRRIASIRQEDMDDSSNFGVPEVYTESRPDVQEFSIASPRGQEFCIASPRGQEQFGLLVQEDGATHILLLNRSELQEVAPNAPAPKDVKSRQGVDEWDTIMNGREGEESDEDDESEHDTNNIEFASSEDVLQRIENHCKQYAVTRDFNIYSRPRSDAFVIGRIGSGVQVDTFEEDETQLWRKVYCQLNPSGKIIVGWFMLFDAGIR